MTDLYTPGGVLGPFTKPNIEPAKGHWALHQAYSSKNHAGSASQDVFHAARMYVELGNVKLPKYEDSRLKALVGVVHSKDGATGYVDFHLSGLSYGYQERSQLQVAQEDNFVEYFFGSTPSTITLQGVLLNTIQDDWSNNMLEIYWNVLRGTKMAARRALVRLRVMDRIYSFTLRSFSENFSTSSSTTTGFSISGTLYSIKLVPSPAQHYLPTDVKGLARSSARRAASSRVSSAIQRGEGNALLNSAPLVTSGLLLGPDAATITSDVLRMQLSGGLPTVAQTVEPPPDASPEEVRQRVQAADQRSDTQARSAGLSQGLNAARAQAPALRPTTTSKSAGQSVTPTPTVRRAPGTPTQGGARRDPPHSSSNDFHSMDPGSGGW